ncbi:MAG: hypothetical protein ACXVA9_01955 [Bdellovibrionales bacterium]
MKWTALFTFVTIAISCTDAVMAAGIDHSQDLCKEQKAFFTEQFQNRKTVKELAQDIAKSNAEVILVGETHFETDNRYYPFFLEKLKNEIPDLGCVTFELNTRDKFPVEFGSERWRVLADRAKTLGLKIFMIDRCVPALDVFHDFLCLDGRNAFMSQKIKTLIKAGICRRIIHVGGSMHLQDSRLGGDPNLSERISGFNISNYRVQLIDMAMEAEHPEESRFRDDDAWIWGRHDSSAPICNEHPGVIRENFAFLNRGVERASRVPVFSHDDLYIQSQPWSDFDAALVLGCPDRANDICPDLPAVSGYLNSK